MKKNEADVLMMAIHMRCASAKKHLVECRQRGAEAARGRNLIFEAYYMGMAEMESEYIEEMERCLSTMSAQRMEDDAEWKFGR